MNEYAVSNWTLIEWKDEDQYKIMYLKSAKKINKNLKWGDTLGIIGGFIVIVEWIVGSLFGKCNQRYLKRMLY